MKADHHETFRHIIDKTLAGEVNPQEEQSLRGHLQSCAPCQEYLSANTRIIASLGGFSFDVDPGLNARIHSALRLRAQQLEARQPSRRHLAWSFIIALILTAAGSFLDLQFGRLAAAVLHVQPLEVQRGLLVFWIVPSLCLVLLFPMLPALLAANTNRKGSI